MLLLTRQKIPVFDRKTLAGADGLLKGAYILSKEKGNKPALILIASGSEVEPVLAAQCTLWEEDIDARVVSMPSWEIFREQDEAYRQSVLPGDVPQRLAVEAGSPLGWREWVGDSGVVIGIEKFGASAPYKEVFKHYGFTVENILAKAKALLK